MRLIDVKAFLDFDRGEWEAGTQLLLEFNATELEEMKYTVLSHCWDGPKNEVHYPEMVALTNMDAVARDKIRQCRGYLKIRKSCELALKDGMDWLWVDTCCIDKRSSAELSEAINSMYLWYANSDRCYAFLHDTDASALPTSLDDKFTEFNGWPKWFSRGWTLQELVAPGNVQFLNQNWQHIGDKQGCAPALSTITRISTDVLKKGLGETRPSVAQIMSWAANRKTTLEEDRAYSILGLLGIHMPILYGEGKNAFLRLQLEVIRTVNDQSIFAWGWTKEYGWSSSFLADNPSQFQDCSTIEKMDHDKFHRLLGKSLSKRVLRRVVFAEERNRTFAATNDGIHIWLPLRLYQRSADSELFSVTLACYDAQNGSEAITIFMEKCNSAYSRCFRAPLATDDEGRQPIKLHSVVLPYRGSIHRKVRGPLSPRNRSQAQISMSEIEPDDVVIIVLGPLGSGKSNIINKLTGMPPEPNADALNACTKTVTAYAHVRKGRRFVFIDTPAFEQDKFQNISTWSGFISRGSTVLTGVIYTHGITVKCSRTDERNFGTLSQICRERTIDRLRLVTTMWDDASLPEATEAERVLKEKYAKSLLDAGSGYERFDNTPELAWKIVEGLQKEMADDIGSIYRKVRDTQDRAQAKISMPDIKSDDVVIAVLGSPGSGKSNIINKLIGMPPEPNADALKACTENVGAYTRVRKGKRFVFIDTPAFELDNFQTISMSLGLMFRRSIMLTGVIYTYDITVKCTPPDERNFAILLKMCGEGAIDRLRLVTTMWDDPSSPEATEAEHALKEKYAKSLLDAGSGYERFDNTPESAWKIVEGLGDKKQALKLQEEIVNNVVDWWKASAFVGIPGVRV